MIAYRSLREEEEDPSKSGLQPPAGHDSKISATAHITAGSKAKTKSRFISGSRSKKSAGAWASTNKRGRVAEYDIPPDSGHLDMTRPSHQQQVFPGGQGTGLNSAKASQEVLVPDEVPPEYIKSIYEAEKLTVAEYELRKKSGVDEAQELFRSRTKTKNKARPVPFALHRVYDREAASAERLGTAREYWDAEIADVVQQTNEQFSGNVNFEEIDADDVIEFLEEWTDNPHSLDYIENDAELDLYLMEIDHAIRQYILHMMARY